jgi:hypothetical protein
MVPWIRTVPDGMRGYCQDGANHWHPDVTNLRRDACVIVFEQISHASEPREISAHAPNNAAPDTSRCNEAGKGTGAGWLTPHCAPETLTSGVERLICPPWELKLNGIVGGKALVAISKALAERETPEPPNENKVVTAGLKGLP